MSLLSFCVRKYRKIDAITGKNISINLRIGDGPKYVPKSMKGIYRNNRLKENVTVTQEKRVLSRTNVAGSKNHTAYQG